MNRHHLALECVFCVYTFSNYANTLKPRSSGHFETKDILVVWAQQGVWLQVLVNQNKVAHDYEQMTSTNEKWFFEVKNKNAAAWVNILFSFPTRQVRTNSLDQASEQTV